MFCPDLWPWRGGSDQPDVYGFDAESRSDWLVRNTGVAGDFRHCWGDHRLRILIRWPGISMSSSRTATAGCVAGHRVFDVHRFLADALVHITDLAAASEPVEVFVHRLEDGVENLPARA